MRQWTFENVIYDFRIKHGIETAGARKKTEMTTFDGADGSEQRKKGPGMFPLKFSKGKDRVRYS